MAEIRFKMHTVAVCVRVTVLLVVSACVAAFIRAPDLKTLYDDHRWFELREAIDGAAPALHQGAVACVFNDGARCEKARDGRGTQHRGRRDRRARVDLAD